MKTNILLYENNVLLYKNLNPQSFVYMFVYKTTLQTSTSVKGIALKVVELKNFWEGINWTHNKNE